MGDLWFHLYLNAYANNQSLHLTESKGMFRGTKMTRGYGWQDITKVVAGGVDVTDSLTFRVPRDTAIRPHPLSVDLPAPVESGGEVEVQIPLARVYRGCAGGRGRRATSSS